MQIAIGGSGNVGRALATLLAAHDVRFASREPDEPSPVPGVARCAFAETGDAELVILATPAPAVLATVEALSLADGVVLVDASNPFGVEPGTSTAALAAAAAPQAHVVKAFHTVGSEVLADPSSLAAGELRPVLTLCGDDAGALDLVGGLAGEVGFEPVVLGGLDATPVAEGFARTWITLSRGATGRHFAFALLR